LLKADKTPGYAREYSRQSLTHPALYEVGFDDFVGQCQRQSHEPAALTGLLSQIATGLKSDNPQLKLGITVYEDELTSSEFPLERIDDSFRRQVDFVHLFPHYRQEAQSYSSSVRRANQLFPNAQVITGIYAYDRRDYLPCARGSSSACSDQQEVELFRQSLKERLAATPKEGWIELYPGGFGKEDSLDVWKEPRSCKPERLRQCIENTSAMRQALRQMLTQ
jgi:hypothetical protein